MDLGIKGRNALVCAASKGLGCDARKNAIPAGRFGEPAEFGELCAFLCSAQASYITGQNFLIDGGTYPGTY